MPMDEQTIDPFKKLADVLKKRYHAQGEQLEQLILSCEERLPQHIVKKLYFNAQLQAQWLKGDLFAEHELTQVLVNCQECEQALIPRGSRLLWKTVIFLLVAVSLGSLIFYFLYWDEITQPLL